jgi:hypothetical protein
MSTSTPRIAAAFKAEINPASGTKYGVKTRTESCAAFGKTDLTVYHDNLAMVAQVHDFQSRRHERRIENRDGHTFASQWRDGGRAREARVHVINQHADRNAALYGSV